MVESAFHSSSQLSGRAERLAQVVSSLRLRQGSADEALVRRAAELHRMRRQAAFDEITTGYAGFADHDMDVFAFDRQGIYRAFAGRPERAGTSVRDVPGVDGDKLVRDAFEQVAHGGGWVDYDFASPQTGGVDMKTSYVEPIGSDLVLGCGVYKARGVPAEAARPRRMTGMREEQRMRLAGSVAPAA
jgi:signal transduction histidine kinase